MYEFVRNLVCAIGTVSCCLWPSRPFLCMQIFLTFTYYF